MSEAWRLRGITGSAPRQQSCVRMLKFSQFNHIVSVPGENSWAVHNFVTGATERLDALQKALFDAAPALPASSPIVGRWRASGFLVRADLDETACLRGLAEERAVDFACASGPYPLVLTVCVTSACNFACPYCYQETGALHMSKDVQRALARFVEDRLATGRHDRLEIDWFGGEPLLALRAVEYLSQQFIDLAQRYAVSYRARVHTNGYLLDRPAIDVLERCLVQNVTITIDGDRDSHDATRHLKDGGATYDRIVANLRAIRTSMRIFVRCNLHEGNVESFPALKQLVENTARESGVEMHVSPAAVRPTRAAAGRGDTTGELSFDRCAQVLSEHGRARKRDLYLPTLSPCGMTRLNELHIEADGTIFPNCHNAPYVSDLSLGNVLDSGPADWEAAAHRVFDTVGFPDDRPECLGCKLLACCHGGCHAGRWYRDDILLCSEYRADPDSYVLERLGEHSSQK